MVPERRSQVACGFSESVRHHWLWTRLGRSAIGCPVVVAITGEEGAKDQFRFGGGVVAEVGVEGEGFAEANPAAEGAVGLFMGGLLFGVQDDCVICTMDVNQETISGGSGEMAKVRGICWGKKV